MITATSPAALAASIAAILASAAFLATMLGYRRDPTTRPLIGVAVALLLGALVHLAVVDLAPVRDAMGIAWGPTESVGGFWLLIAFDLPAVVGGFWFLFALQYTGRDRQTSPIALAAVAVLLLGLVAPNVALAAAGSFGVQMRTLNALLGITTVLAESLALVGVFLVVATTLRHKAFPAAQTALLTAAIGAVLVLPFAAATLQTPVTTPAAIAASSGLFTAAVRRYRVFETLPVASVVGRDRVIDEMAEGVVMVDGDGRVRDLNPEAESLLGVDRSAAVGASLDDAAPAFPRPDALAAAGPTDVRTDAGRTLTVTADAVTDARERTLGHLLVCRDVTGKRRREHRLSVLTQVVAGATQEQLDVVADLAADVAAGERDPESGGERIRDTATGVAALVARVRDVERALAERDDRPATADAAAAVRDLEATTEVTRSADAAPVAVDPALLRAVLETLATGVSDGTVELRADGDDDAAIVRIAPFDPDDDSVAGLAFRIARLAAEDARWSVDANDGMSVTVRLPQDSKTRRSAGETA